jgi:hypothetical protein
MSLIGGIGLLLDERQVTSQRCFDLTGSAGLARRNLVIIIGVPSCRSSPDVVIPQHNIDSDTGMVNRIGTRVKWGWVVPARRLHRALSMT